MASLNLNNQQYDIDKLSDAAKSQIMHLRAIEAEIDRAKMQQSIFATAHAAYLQALQAELAKTPEALIGPVAQAAASQA